ncbi:NAD(P)-dependent alcohol dehydrogenase [Corynebacterium hylobatis]|uniref:NAD(P)-dependent alcohol dehydrogenase n=1 Tax=Corynebacterium hylobatis TaxID=1859290 RepID=A0A3S0C1N5_9CORY|nr:NAD(P)-dependent alcohol dehydrogenase [Corynebacterium hylobatis]RSZ63886.1 NAD(P)-dependent alcohol dehydrogenase [Corynebacterium hylobatis]
MKAVVHTGYHTFPSLKEVEKPTPGPGEVLLKVAGAGACHSDVAIFHEFDEGLNPQMDPEFILGHENSGWIEELGPGVQGFEIGSAHLVYGPVGCGHCRACTRGQDTYCENAAKMPYAGIGLGRDGGMAEYVVVPARNLIPLGDADPINAAPLADAGLTPYHAIKLALPKLNGGGKTALVIGLGGLGLVGVQILKALTGATIIATDMKEEAMAEAEKLGAVTVPGGEGQVERIREITGGKGVDAIFDFVGIGATVSTAMKSVARQGRVTIVGIGNLSPYEWAFLTTPYEAELVNTYWGTVEELHEVVDMYKAGQIVPQVATYSLDEALEAYQLLVDGKIAGRAVIVPHQ